MNEFFAAIQNNEISKINDLCDKYGANFQDEKGRTPLQCAAYFGRLEITKLLLSLGADANTKDNIEGFVPLHLAAYTGHLRIVELLLKSTNDVDAKAIYNQTPLFSAVNKGHVKIAKCLIKSGSDVNVIIDTHDSPLISATRNGHYEIVQLLLENSADPNLVEGLLGDYPLHIAIENGNHDIAELLIKHGADLNRSGAIFGGKPLYRAVNCNDLEMVKMLVNAGAKVNEKNDTFGDTALHMAVYYCAEEIARFLLEHGADMTLTDEFGKTAIDYLLFFQEVELRRQDEDLPYNELAQVFNVYGANLVCENHHSSWIKRTPRFKKMNHTWGKKEEMYVQALNEHDFEAIKRLIGVNINLSDKSGNTLLHHTVIPREEKSAVAENDMNSNKTHLKKVVRRRPDIEIIELLITHGVKINAVNHFNETALDIALSYFPENDPIVQLLQKNNAKRFIEVRHMNWLNRLGEFPTDY